MGFWDVVLPGQSGGSRALVPVEREPEAPPARAVFQGGSYRQLAQPPVEHVFEQEGSGRKRRHENSSTGDCFQQGYCGTCDKNPEFCPIAKMHLPKVDDIPCGGIYA